MGAAVFPTSCTKLHDNEKEDLNVPTYVFGTRRHNNTTNKEWKKFFADMYL